MTLLGFLDRFPPRLCRLVARKAHGQKALSLREISVRSGLSLSTVSEISMRKSWRGLTVESVQAFAYGCGVNFFSLRRQVEFLKRGRWVHMARANREQRRMFDRLLRGT